MTPILSDERVPLELRVACADAALEVTNRMLALLVAETRKHLDSQAYVDEFHQAREDLKHRVQDVLNSYLAVLEASNAAV